MFSVTLTTPHMILKTRSVRGQTLANICVSLVQISGDLGTSDSCLMLGYVQHIINFLITDFISLFLFTGFLRPSLGDLDL